MRQLPPFTQIDSIKKTQIGVFGPGDISDVYINNYQSFEAINILDIASWGLEKTQTKTAKFGIDTPIAR